MISRFSLYDFIAVVVPGVLFMWALGTLAGIESLRRAVPLTGGITETSVLVVVGYVVGLLLQGLGQQITERLLLWWWGGFPSARWLLPDERRFSKQYTAELTEALRTKFGIEFGSMPADQEPKEDTVKRNQEIFYRCYRSVEKLTDLPQTFVAQYGLFRALLTTFGLLAVIGVWRAVAVYGEAGTWDVANTVGVALWILGAVISYWRVTKRGEDFAKAVYDAFLAHAGERKTE